MPVFYVRRIMDTEILASRIEKFHRSIATCLCAIPFLFALQCVVVAFFARSLVPLFEDFEVKLPIATHFILNTWYLFPFIGIATPIGVFILARKGNPNTSIITSTIVAIILFVLAQFMTIAAFLPIFRIAGL